MLEKQYSEESEDAAHRRSSNPRGYFSHSPTIHRQLWNIVIPLSLTYQQDVMEWSYVPAYLDSLCFLEWRVS